MPREASWTAVVLHRFPSGMVNLAVSFGITRTFAQLFLDKLFLQAQCRRHHIDMAYVPNDAEWFLAEIVQEIRVAGSRRNIVHQNFVIINAPSPKAAYAHANDLGKKGNISYANESGKKVTVRFRGLRSLDVIYDPLEHGCEIMFIEKLGVTENGIKKLLRAKNDLEVFLPIRGRPGRPNFSSKEIMDMVKKKLVRKK